MESALEKQESAVSKESALTDVKDSGKKPGTSGSSDDSDSSDDSGSSGDSGGSSDPAPAPGDGSRLPASATAAEISAALARYDHVTVGDGATAMTLDGPVSVARGKTLDLNGPETIAAGAGLSVDGTVNASRGLVTSRGTW